MQCKIWGRNFDLMLKEDLGRWLFEQHLQREFSVENLDFYTRCIAFRNASISELESEIKTIYK